MGQRKLPLELEEFTERSRRLEAGELPQMEVSSLSSWLAQGEAIHHFSQPVYAEDGYFLGSASEGNRLFVTDRRLLLCKAEVCQSFPYEKIEELVEEHPGFWVKVRGEYERQYFFPPALDPVFSAIVGAIRNFRAKAAPATT